MKYHRVILTLLLLQVSSAEERVVEEITRITPEARDPFEVFHEDRRFTIIPQKHFSYESFAMSEDGRFLYVVADDHRKKEWEDQSIKKIVLRKYYKDPENYIPEDIPLKVEFDRFSIVDLYAVSEERQKLLLQINRKIFQEDDWVRYKSHPYFLDLRTGKIEPVKP